MQPLYAEARALALSYLLLACVLLLGGYAFWSHWYIATLPGEAGQLGAAVRGAPASLTALTVPLLLWAIASSGKGTLKSMIHQHRLLYALVAGVVCAITISAAWLLLDAPYQWGAQDRVVVTIMLVPLTLLGIGVAGYAIAARIDSRTGLR